MAIVGTPTKKSDREHSLTDNTISEMEVWQVLTDGSSTLAQIRDASGVPTYYTVHPTDPKLYVNSKRVRSVNGSITLFEVEVSYTGSTLGPVWPDNLNEIIGLTRDEDRQWSTVETVETIDTDVNGNKIQNVCKEDPDPPPTAMRGYTSLSISRNEPWNEYGAAKGEAFVFHTNSGPFFGAPPGSCLCKSISAQAAKTSQFFYWRMTYQFVFKRSFLPVDYGPAGPWVVRMANTGTLQPKLLEGGAMGYENILLSGERPSKPVPLDLSGFPAWQTQGNKDTYWLGFKIYNEADFSLLRLES